VSDVNRIDTAANITNGQLRVFVQPPTECENRVIMLQRTIMESLPNGEWEVQFGWEMNIKLTEAAARRLRKQLKWALNYKKGDPIPD